MNDRMPLLKIKRIQLRKRKATMHIGSVLFSSDHSDSPRGFLLARGITKPEHLRDATGGCSGNGRRGRLWRGARAAESEQTPGALGPAGVAIGSLVTRSLPQAA